MRIPGARRFLAVTLTAVVTAALAGCSGSSSTPGGGAGPATIGTVGVAPGTATAPGATVGGGGTTTDATATDGTPTGSASEDSPTVGPVQSGIVDPNDPQGVAKAYGVTLVDPQAAGMVAFGMISFRSPSGRIICALQDESGGDPANARCDVNENTWKPPAKPADCDLDWGGSVGVEDGRGRAHFNCVGDVASDGRGVLAYGKGLLAGSVLCMSRQTGIECVVTSGPKHGFKVSKASYSLY